MTGLSARRHHSQVWLPKDSVLSYYIRIHCVSSLLTGLLQNTGCHSSRSIVLAFGTGTGTECPIQLATPITIRQTRYLEDYGKDGTQVEGPRAQLNQEEVHPRWPDTARPERADPTRLKGGVRITTVKVGRAIHLNCD